MDFTKLDRFAKKLEAFDVDAIINLSAKKNEAYLLSLVFDEQLYKDGVFPDGRATGDYAPFTVNYKNSSGSHDHKTDHITYKDEGGFYAGRVLRIRGDEIEADSTDSKRDELVKQEGDMLGWTKESIEKMSRKVFLPDIQKKIEKIMK